MLMPRLCAGVSPNMLPCCNSSMFSSMLSAAAFIVFYRLCFEFGIVKLCRLSLCELFLPKAEFRYLFQALSDCAKLSYGIRTTTKLKINLLSVNASHFW